MAGKITAIRVQKRNPNRANVYVDEEFALGLPMIEAAKLSKGQFLSDSDIAALRAANERERAHEYALNLLSYRPRSSAEVTRRLRQKGFSQPTIDTTLERLLRAQLLDDEAFARYWISNRERFRPRGSYALRYELRQKGIADDVIDTLLGEFDETDSAYRAAMQRLSGWQRSDQSRQTDPAKLQRRLTDYLRRRGFSYTVIRDVWERIVAESDTGKPDPGEREESRTWD